MSSKRKKKSKKNKSKLLARVIVIFMILVAVYVGYLALQKTGKDNDLFEDVESSAEATLSEYIVYGTHLNIKGNLILEDSNFLNVSLAFKTLNEEDEKAEKLSYKKTSSGIEFYTSELINEGIDLEKLNNNMYYIFVKVEYPEEVYKYYSIKNETKYKDIEYHTITKEEKNSKIDIKFATHKKKVKNLNYMYINVVGERLPNDVYDIVIDPGHGRNR